MAPDDRRRLLHHVSVGIIRAQSPIRVLAAVTWSDRVRARFLAKGGGELPRVTYAPLRFDAGGHDATFRDLMRRLDPRDPLQNILHETCDQYRQVVGMLVARGTPGFLHHSRALYGSAADTFMDGRTTNLDLARHLGNLLGGRVAEDMAVDPDRRLPAERVAHLLRKRFRRVFVEDPVEVEVSTQVTADAAAGAARVKLRKGRRFSPATVDYLEQHEGYVHIATTLNGRRQPVLPVLGKASPRAVKYNEGLAVFSEWASGKLTVSRLRRLTDRVLSIHMAERGADFLEVFRFARSQGAEPEDAYDIAHRVFRGGDPKGGSFFTKDASYLDHFVRVFNFFRLALLQGYLHLLDLLFAGKVTLEDLPALREAEAEGLIVGPRYLPPWLRDRNWLACHMSLSSFFNKMDLRTIEGQYEALFRRCGQPL
ncbi:MAG: flavohemoglobin expression-modulating QEGLA motif protein [Planctomycetales bacterium]|nr:flavohemoglobin expression-modulating QEGLA motif protein [Planctomycetales bacterium]